MLNNEQLIYDYLLKNCVGFENRVKAQKIMKIFNIKDHKTFRSYIENIRQSNEFEKLIGSRAGQQGGYYIITNDQEFKDTTEHFYLRAMEMLKTYGNMKNKYLKQEERLEV